MKKWIKHVPITEWFEERTDGIYCIWELATGERIERLTLSYGVKVPHVAVNWLEVLKKFE